jgi:hypothetical protein
MGQEQFSPWAAQAAAERLASYYKRRGAEDDVRKVIFAYGNAFEQLAAKATQHWQWRGSSQCSMTTVTAA